MSGDESPGVDGGFPGGPNESDSVPLDAIERQRRSELEIRNRLANWPGDPIAIDLPALPGEAEIEFIDPSDAASRMLAFFAIAVRGESLAGPQPIPLARIADRMPIAVAALSAAETDMMSSDRVPLEQIDAMAWRYEAVLTLQWALQMQPDLPWPDERCDLATVSKLMLELPHDDIVGVARWRPFTQLIDAADLHYRAWWAIAAAQANGYDVTSAIDPGIVAERWAVLAWICGLSRSTAKATFADVEAWIDAGMPAS